MRWLRHNIGVLAPFLRSGLKTVGPDRPRLGLVVLVALVTGVLETAVLLLIGSIVLSVADQRDFIGLKVGIFQIHMALPGALLLAGGALVPLVAATWLLAVLQSSLSESVVVRLRTRLITAFLMSSTSYRDAQREGFLQQVAVDFCQRAEHAVQFLGICCATGCAMLVVLGSAVFASPRLALAFIVGLGLSAALASPLARAQRQDLRRAAQSGSKLGSEFAQVHRLSDDIATLNVGPQVVARLGSDIRAAGAILRLVRYKNRLLPNLYLYGMLALVLAVMSALIAVNPHSGHATFPPVALLLVRALVYVRQFLNAVQSGNEAAPYVDVVNSALTDLEAHRSLDAGVAPPFFSALSFDRVGFAYEIGEPVLQNISFTLSPGEVIGLVGPSGSGKSTVCALLLRLRNPTQGTVTMGGTPLADIMPAAWSKITAYVPQDTKLVSDTIANNIRCFRDGFSLAEVEAAARAAHVHDEIAALPDGYDTIVGPGGRGLSGGQRQRLAIARALIGRPQLLVLDEPTSALDQRSEGLIGETLSELKRSMTIVLVAHRPATLALCDRVLHLVGGTIVDHPKPVLLGR